MNNAAATPLPEFYCVGNSRRKFRDYQHALHMASALASKTGRPVLVYQVCAMVEPKPPDPRPSVKIPF